MPPRRSVRPTSQPASGPSFAYEQRHWAAGRRFVLGLDEVGAGPLMGPTVAAGVVFDPGADPAAFAWARDSKRCSKKTIHSYGAAIRAGAFRDAGLLAFGIGAASVAEIARLNIKGAIALAMQRAAIAATRQLRAAGLLADEATLDMTLVDGLPLKQFPLACETAPRFESLSLSVAAASMLAKHVRDRLCERLAVRHPAYACWARNAGYGTAEHLAVLERIGPVPGVHRWNYTPIATIAERVGVVSRPGRAGL